MVRSPSTEAYILGSPSLEPMIVLNLLDLSEEIRNEPNYFRRNAYHKTVFNTIVGCLDTDYPHSPSIIIMN